MTALCAICARGGSKGVPNKNIRLLGGKPLIAYSIETGLKCKLINRLIVSTESEEIARVAEKYGAEVPFMRPPELARDNSPEWNVWRHIVQKMTLDSNYGERDIFVSLPPTSPFRSAEDVSSCITFLQNSDADIVITVRSASRHPSFNMVVFDKDNYARIAQPPEKTITRRQDAPAVYDMTTAVYVTRPEYIIRSNSIFEGRVKALILPEERALDIDTELDFSFAEFLMNRRNSRQ
ncbi:MAG: acylneuraminate cytidylyltransferase family protein [bacterium]